VSREVEPGFEVIDFITVNRDIDDLCAIEMDYIMARKPDWERPTKGRDKAGEEKKMTSQECGKTLVEIT
jgi:hypothetical protein